MKRDLDPGQESRKRINNLEKMANVVVIVSNLCHDQSYLLFIANNPCGSIYLAQNFNDILRSRVNLKLERSLSEKQFQRSQTTQR